MKLIRDNIKGLDYEKKTFKCDKSELKTYLKNKLMEEIEEVEESDYLDIKEYADVLEVLMSIAKYHKIKWNDVEIARKIKLKENGGFTNTILKD